MSQLNQNNLKQFEFKSNPNVFLPNAVDWRNAVPNVINSIKDQGECGACWSFSALGALESAYAITNGMLPDLSEQNLVDCVYNYDGCQGGFMTDVWAYIQSKIGVETESAYPYTSGTTKKVKKKTVKISLQ